MVYISDAGVPVLSCRRVWVLLQTEKVVEATVWVVNCKHNRVIVHRSLTWCLDCFNAVGFSKYTCTKLIHAIVVTILLIFRISCLLFTKFKFKSYHFCDLIIFNTDWSDMPRFSSCQKYLWAFLKYGISFNIPDDSCQQNTEWAKLSVMVEYIYKIHFHKAHINCINDANIILMKHARCCVY